MSVSGVSGRAFASLYRTDGPSLDLKTGVLQGGMMNNGSYRGVAISTDPVSYTHLTLPTICSV